jgi:predicted acylesterase/phospholipase RssA
MPATTAVDRGDGQMTDPVSPDELPATAAEANEQDAVSQVAGQNWAICCSGGGIRSATYCLGALQTLEKANCLGKTRLILGVSGGSYIAASRALVACGLQRDGASGPAA